jgi:hypothetical protein
MPTLQDLEQRHDTSTAQCAEMIALANGSRLPPPIPGNITRIWNTEYSRWCCWIHGKEAWWVDDMWRDLKGYPFWCDGNGNWNGYEKSMLCSFDETQQAWIPYRDYTGMEFDSLPNWQDAWKAVLTGINLVWSGDCWLDGDKNQYWFENATWNRQFEDDIQRRDGNDWESYRSYDKPGPFDTTPQWTENGWETTIGGIKVQWREDAWRQDNDNVVWWSGGFWWVEEGILQKFWDSVQQTWLPFQNYEPLTDAAYGSTPYWQEDKWATTIHGVPVSWSDVWLDASKNPYTLGSEGIWMRTIGTAIYTFINDAWTPRYDGENFSTPPVMHGETLKATLGDRSVSWDEGENGWYDNSGIEYKYDSAKVKWFCEDTGTNYVLEGSEWQQTHAKYEQPKEFSRLTTLLYSIHEHSKAIKDIAELNKNEQQIADQYEKPLDNEQQWNDFMKASGNTYKSGGNMADECFKLKDSMDALAEIPFIGEAISLSKAVKSIKKVSASSSERSAFRKAMKGAHSKPVREMACYAYKKVNRRFYINIADCLLAINDFISKLITLITLGAAAIAVAISKALMAVRLLTLGLAQNIKGFWKWLKGTKGKGRSNNADVLINALMVRDTSALTLIGEIHVKFDEIWIDQRLEKDANHDLTPAAVEARKKIKAAHKEIAKKMKSN